MDPAGTHARAQAAFAAVVAAVSNDDLARPTPCDDWDVQALISHVVDANRWVVKLAGAGRVAVTGDPAADHAASSAAAQAVFDSEENLSKPFDLPWGPTPGRAFAITRATDVYTHAWDLARAIGASTDLDRELGEQLLAGAHRVFTPELRGFAGFFGTERPCNPERPVADRLAAYLGRDVDWTP